MIKKKQKEIFSFVLGTRPEVIKLAPLIRSCVLQKIPFEIIATGQHYEDVMFSDFWKELGLPKIQYQFVIPKNQHSLIVFANLINQLTTLWTKKSAQKRIVLVQGDTNSTLVGAIVAKKLGLKLVHLESGFRSGNKNQPEEINRILVDELSDLNFAMDQAALSELKKLGFKLAKNLFFVENTSFESADYILKKISKKIVVPSEPYVILTIHRAETVTNPKRMNEIIKYYFQLQKRYKVIWVVHPRTRDILKKNNVLFVEPMGHGEFLAHLNSALIIISDSGGIVTEAKLLDKPLVILRKETEYQSIIQENRATLVSPDLSSKKMYKLSLEFLKRFQGESSTRKKFQFNKKNTNFILDRILKFV